ARSARRARRTPRCARRPPNSRRRSSISRTRVSPPRPGAPLPTSRARPASGLIANLEIRPGSMVQQGVPLFTIIGDNEYWVDANFKETELRRVKPGQEARVVMDMYPRHQFKGVVQSLAGGAGQAFSLLPAQNATGNWVKVTQRVP